MKRKRASRAGQRANKKQKLLAQSAERPSHALLEQYYPEVVTLRQYLASRLPKKRRRILQHYGRDVDGEKDDALAHLLDTTLVGSFKHVQVDDSSFVDDDISLFTQQISETSTAPSSTPGKLKQPEIVDFAIWMLFRKQPGNLRPQHLLCQNYQRYLTQKDSGPGPEIAIGIPGVYSNGPHNNVATLKSHPWIAVPDVLGRGAERILADMLMECGLFAPVGDGNNFVQVSGLPMSGLAPLANNSNGSAPDGEVQYEPFSKEPLKQRSKRKLTEIRFLRYRMLYGQPMLNTKGRVLFGLHQLHALNRFSSFQDTGQTHHIMKYIFPLQFGLHNVFTSDVDSKDTAHAFKDYTIRDKEIVKMVHARKRKQPVGEDVRDSQLPALPKRLRGMAESLVARLRKRHSACSYSALLHYYCPRRHTPEQDQQKSLSRACKLAEVSSFCRAVVMRVFPKDLWGQGEAGKSNVKVLLSNIDHFVRLRRYETLGLHDVLQKMSLDLDWLRPRNQDTNVRLSASDFAKRKELMSELLYYLFDSFLSPLVRSHFHVTESNAQRNQLFYFRQDVWRELCEPAMDSLKLDMLEQCNPGSAIGARQLGVSHVRLVPKEIGMRPIINLRRRVQKMQHGRWVLGRSVNSLLTPTFSILNYEKTRGRHDLGSALFSVDDIFPMLQKYRHSLQKNGFLGKTLYFAKVDVQGCFDSIPQDRLMELAKHIIGENEYQISRYSRAKLLGAHSEETPGFGAKPSWKFLTKAGPAHRAFDFGEEVNSDIAEGRRRAVYIDGLAPKHESRRAILTLLQEHVQSNFIQIGPRLYRQKKGIPQGSIISSLLCSYFYADMEREMLAFVNDGNSVLLRLIDDFLVISTDRKVAEQFMRTMHAGIAEYGVRVRLEKSRANFDLQIDGRAVPKITAAEFPYCGNAIDTRTLDLSKDSGRRKTTNIADSVAVEYTKLPGQTFYRKLLNALKLQMRAMLLSTSYNSPLTVLSNLYHIFVEVAQKSNHYIRSLPLNKQPPGKLTIRAIDDMVKLACVLMKHRRRTSKDVMAYACSITSAQARWLACTSFVRVFGRRQTKHQMLLGWLKVQLGLPAQRAQARSLQPIVLKYGSV
ncbi:Telomerase reverse transcriptase [Cercospora zeina]